MLNIKRETVTKFLKNVNTDDWFLTIMNVLMFVCRSIYNDV